MFIFASLNIVEHGELLKTVSRVLVSLRALNARIWIKYKITSRPKCVTVRMPHECGGLEVPFAQCILDKWQHIEPSQLLLQKTSSSRGCLFRPVCSLKTFPQESQVYDRKPFNSRYPQTARNKSMFRSANPEAAPELENVQRTYW